MKDLTPTEKDLLSQIACDSESGRHLLCPRSDEYKQMLKELADSLQTDLNLCTDRQRMLRSYYFNAF